MQTVKIEDHTAEVMAKIDEALETALMVVGEFIGGEAQENLSKPQSHKTPSKDGLLVHPIVDTGLLRNSISYGVDGCEYFTLNGHEGATASMSGSPPKESKGERSVVIGTPVEYAEFIEYGTSRMPAGYPYLRPALAKNLDKVSKYISDELSKLND